MFPRSFTSFRMTKGGKDDKMKKEMKIAMKNK
jgi:hypothetical protein